MTGNKPDINVIQQNQDPSPQNTTGKDPKTLKIPHIIYILLAPSVRKNWTLQTEVNAKNKRKLQHAPRIPNFADQGIKNVLFHNQPNAQIFQIYSVIKLYMFRASSLPIIRSFVL